MPGFTVLIPARLGSSRLPDKPLADIGGLPMVVRVARQAKRSSASRVVVATDSERVALACEWHGVESVMTRGDHACGSDRLAEASSLLGLPDHEIVVNVQGDEPMIDPALIDAVAFLVETRPDAAMGTAAHPIRDGSEFESQDVVKVVLDERGMALYFSRAPIPARRDGAARFDGADAPLRHIGIYSYRAAFLRAFGHLPQAPAEKAEALEQLRALWHGHRIAVHVTQQEPGPGIDTPHDLERVRTLVSRVLS